MAPPDTLSLPAGRSVATDGEGLTVRAGAGLARRERLLWCLAILALLADVTTTLAGLQVGLTEGNPVVAGALADAGPAGFLGVKVGVLAIAVGARLLAPRFRVAIPLGIALPWFLAAGTNAALLVAIS